jgi:very-short-patch-repair endonuclease
MKRHPHNLNYLKQTRQNLRKNSTPQEQILWHMLRRKNFIYKFKRQHSIGNFIVDFYCPTKKLVVELDGSQHLENKEYDEERRWYFESLGIKEIRFWNSEIDNDLKGVMNKIKPLLSSE